MVKPEVVHLISMRPIILGLISTFLLIVDFVQLLLEWDSYLLKKVLNLIS